MPIQTASARLRYIFYLYRISQFIPYMDPVPYRALLSRVQDDAQRKYSYLILFIYHSLNSKS